jgi:hypothetical protein
LRQGIPHAAGGVDPYVVLVETLRAICEREIALPATSAVRGDRRRDAAVHVVTDGGMLSPKNTFLTVTKPSRPPSGPGGDVSSVMPPPSDGAGDAVAHGVGAVCGECEP